MVKSSSGSHTTVCSCAACTGTQTKSDFMTKSGDYSAINNYHYDDQSGMLISAQGFAINTKTAKGYVQALFGKDSAVWSDGGAGTAAFGNSATVTYSFQDVSWGNYYHWSNGAALDSAQVTAARAAMTMWSNVSNIKFVEGTGATAKIAFHEYNLPAGAGVAVASSYNDDAKGAGDRLAQVEVCVDDSTTGFTAGGYGYLTFIHEVGHAIGLKHPGNYNAGGGTTPAPYLSNFKLVDSRDFTVMSYNAGVITNDTHNPTTPMIYDIAAAQYLYGANTAYNATNTTYTLTGTANAFCRWDGGGVDTLSASNYALSTVIDLREGEAYVTRVGESYSWNAFGSNIENATGGSTNDTLYGNALNNLLTGGGGADTLVGGDGNDTLVGGGGLDTYDFSLNSGSDTVTETDGSATIVIDGATLSGSALKTGAGVYMLVGSTAAFTLTVSGSVCTVTTSAGTSSIALSNFASGKYGITLGSTQVSAIAGTGLKNTLIDTTGNDYIYGLTGDDKLTSSAGADSIYGGAGKDTITMSGVNGYAYGDDDNDSITAKGAGNTVYGGAGDDKITGSSTGQTLNGEDGKDAITGGGAGTIINGGAGDDSITLTVAGATANGGDGVDKIMAKVVSGTMNGDAGNDILTGADGNDTMNGGADNDILKGSKGDDVLTGGIGNDMLYGGFGNDTLTGGVGNDTFYFEKTGGGIDTIVDFTVGQDMLKYASSVTEAAVLAAATQANGDVTITLNGTTLILIDTTIGELTGPEFVW